MTSNKKYDAQTAIREQWAVALHMRKEAELIQANGVVEVITKAQILAWLELASLPAEGLRVLEQLSLAELFVLLTDTRLAYGISPLLMTVGRALRSPDPEGRGTEDTGSNYSGFVGMKAMKSLRTGAPSEEGATMSGESGNRGGKIRDGIAVAFAGGTPEQDIEIADRGLAHYEKLQAVRQFIQSLALLERRAVLRDYWKRKNMPFDRDSDESMAVALARQKIETIAHDYESVANEVIDIYFVDEAQEVLQQLRPPVDFI